MENSLQLIFSKFHRTYVLQTRVECASSLNVEHLPLQTGQSSGINYLFCAKLKYRISLQTQSHTVDQEIIDIKLYMSLT